MIYFMYLAISVIFLLPFHVQFVMFVIILSSTKHFFFKRKLIIYYLFVLFYLNKIVTHQVFCCIYNLSHVSKLIDTCIVWSWNKQIVEFVWRIFILIFSYLSNCLKICHLWYSRAVVNSLVYSSSRTSTRIKFLKEIHV